jgi:hypothetical protein
MSISFCTRPQFLQDIPQEKEEKLKKEKIDVDATCETSLSPLPASLISNPSPPQDPVVPSPSHETSFIPNGGEQHHHFFHHLLQPPNFL